jgi:predicted nuclease of predicted toxin-antitoxin system
VRVLLDENMPVRLRHDLRGHDVATVSFLGWNTSKNGELLEKAETAGFEALVTCDQSLPYQQRMPGVSIRVVIIHARSNDIDDLRPHMAAVLRSLPLMKPGEVLRIP